MTSIPNELKVGILENLDLIALNNVYALALEDFQGCVLYVIQRKFKSYKFYHMNHNTREIIKPLHDDIIKTLIDVRDTNTIYDICPLLSYLGKLECLKYARENGCPWDKWACSYSAWFGHLDILKYAHENGCPWDESTCEAAARNGHLDCLRYARENGCPWDEKTYKRAAHNGHLACLKYAHENGCPWDLWTRMWVAQNGYLRLFEVRA